MSHSDDLETIKVFALKDRENLNSFLRICSCFEEVKTHLRNDFIRILKIFLLENLANRDWALEDRMTDKWDKPYPAILIYYKAKFDLSYYLVEIDSQSRVARGMLYGVKNGESNKTPTQARNMDIFDSINKVDQGGRQTDWFSWYKFLKPPYDDWNKSELLIKMLDSVNLYESKKQFDPAVQCIGKKLVQVAFALETWFKSNT